MKKIFLIGILLSVFLLGIVSESIYSANFGDLEVSDETLVKYSSLQKELTRVGEDYKELRGRRYAVVITEDINIYSPDGKVIIGIIPDGTVIPTIQLEG